MTTASSSPIPPAPASTPADVCFCTLAIHAPYRRRARQLFSDAPQMPWIVLTDAPEDFADLPVQAIAHQPTGPMAVDYLSRLPKTEARRGSAAYHDKRHVLAHGLAQFRTAVFFDADSRIRDLASLPRFEPGIAVLPVVRASVSEHLLKYGTWRRPTFESLARELTGDTALLDQARWCQESVIALTRDGRESRFFDVWGQGAAHFQSREVYSGEGGVIGLAAACAGWTVDVSCLERFGAQVWHEGGGPKRS